jgi:aspartyl-tRNA(Asn)/glutamyl-tRNA(Gln) amidotransferase subunit B
MSAAAWEVVIGIETHAQLSTASKIFSGASTEFGAEPNTRASVIDLALPGVLPVLNRGAVERAIRFGLAVGATIAPRSLFARKNYFYPDLPKGYQISQYEAPVVQGGCLGFEVVPKRGAPYRKTVRLARAHLEEDAGKSLHEDFHGLSGIDLNRAGTPLLEIVTEPDIRVADIEGAALEAVEYARALHRLVVWIGICDGNMQEGSFRCDANVSVRRPGAPLGTRCEIKNLNSFRFLQQAIVYEARRQIDLIESGGRVEQQTRLYDPERGETRTLRGKEDAMDYRYFPDPDLLPLEIPRSWLQRIAAELPELPEQAQAELARYPGLSEADRAALAADLPTYRYFRAVMEELPPAQAKAAANWISGELAAALNAAQAGIAASPVSPARLAGLIARIADGTLSQKIAKEVFAALCSGQAASADELIERCGLRQISDAAAIEPIIDAVLAAHPKSVEEFRAGKEKAFHALVGQAMKATRGQANPQQVNELLRRKLAG